MVSFEIEGQSFMALNGGPEYHFTEAISLYVDCETQKEVDTLWEKFSEGGSKGQCGWLKDKYGLSWQIIPSVFREYMEDPDLVKSQRVMQAMLKMTKIEVAGLKAAYDSISYGLYEHCPLAKFPDLMSNRELALR